jgi:hypothetical protein
MSNSAQARELSEDQGPYREALRLVAAPAAPLKSRGDIIEVAGLALIVLAMFFIAALIFVPQLSGLV